MPRQRHATYAWVGNPTRASRLGDANDCLRGHVSHGDVSLVYLEYNDGAYNLDRHGVPYRTCSRVLIVSHLRFTLYVTIL